MESFDNRKMLGIYIHIPFCKRKCAYCDFVSFVKNADAYGKYVSALLDEIENVNDKFGDISAYEVKTIYFGGGTPSLIDAELIGAILEKIICCFKIPKEKLSEIEITLEVNPGTVDYLKLTAYKNMGINRLSIGLQSANAIELKMLSRIHDYDTFVNTYKQAREVGFDNISVDIMTALPRQDRVMLTNTINKVTALNPEHISAYSLILEEGTLFYEKYKDSEDLPGEETERALYYLTVDLLKQKGYMRYEISNFSKPGYESRHNMSYWDRREYIGFGINAASLFNEVRYKNTDSFEEYLGCSYKRTAFSEIIGLDREERMSEFMFLGLRKQSGISKKEFYDTFLCEYLDCYGNIHNKLLENELIIEDGDRIFLSDKGIDYGNYVFSEYLI